MRNNFIISLKATILNVIVALIFTFIILGAGYNVFFEKLEDTFNLINTVAIKVEKTKEPNDYQFTLSNNRLSSYPEYGTKYATMTIEKIGVELPVYFGDTLDILKKGAGHNSSSYFPGENGSIVYMAHNTKNMLRRLGEVQLGDIINVKTNYGDFNYKVYDTKIILDTDFSSIPIKDDEEILMVYTCYPFINFGYTNRRYVVYAKKI